MQLFHFWCHCNLTADCLYKISQYKYLWGIDNVWWWFYPSASAMQSYACLLKSKPQLCSLGLTHIDCSLKYFYKSLKFPLMIESILCHLNHLGSFEFCMSLKWKENKFQFQIYQGFDISLTFLIDHTRLSYSLILG